MGEKPLEFVGRSLMQLRAFSEDARRRAGFELHQVQLGRSPSDWKPMPAVAPGVVEIRIHTGGEFRILYVAKFDEAVYVLHAFEKKTRKISPRDIALARNRWAGLVRARSGTGATAKED